MQIFNPYSRIMCKNTLWYLVHLSSVSSYGSLLSEDRRKLVHWRIIQTINECLKATVARLPMTKIHVRQNGRTDSRRLSGRKRGRVRGWSELNLATLKSEVIQTKATVMSLLIVTVLSDFHQWKCLVCLLTFPCTHTRVLVLVRQSKSKIGSINYIVFYEWDS